MYKVIKLNLARNSLRYILRTYNIKEIYIPYYLCDVIRHSIIKENCKPIFYHINDDFLPNCEFEKDKFILYPNYFGICDENVKILSKKYPHLIVDNSHSFYSKPSGFACFNSARKFMPVYNGSYLWIKDLPYFPQIEFITKPVENKDLKEESFKNYDILQINKNLENEIEKFNFNKSRKINFSNYHKKYNSTNQLEIKSAFSPFCYPYLAKTNEEAEKIVAEFEKQNIVIYRYWNELPKNYNEYKFYKRLIAIPL